MAISYAANIRPLFRDKDVSSMKNFGGFDLSAYQDVADNADDILARLRKGDMPCDHRWPPADVQLFADWMAQGKQP